MSECAWAQCGCYLLPTCVLIYFKAEYSAGWCGIVFNIQTSTFCFGWSSGKRPEDYTPPSYP